MEGLLNSHGIVCKRFTHADIHERASLDAVDSNLCIDEYVISVVYVSFLC
jgi:hypothetical protein